MSRGRANLLLLLAAAFWGFGNVSQKTVLDHLDPFSAAGLRCLIAGIVVAPLVVAELAAALPRGWWSSQLRVSAIFVAALLLQQIAYLDATVTNASFLVNTATVMTPVAAWLLLGERPTASIAVAASMTLAGALLMSGGWGGSLGKGDSVAVLSAACYAIWMVELGRHAKAHGRPMATAAAQFLSAALILLPLGALHGTMSASTVWEAAPELLVLGIFSTAGAFTLQTIAQRFTLASHAAVMVSAECIFGAMGAALFLDERISAAGALGGMLIFAAIVYLGVSPGKAVVLRNDGGAAM